MRANVQQNALISPIHNEKLARVSENVSLFPNNITSFMFKTHQFLGKTLYQENAVPSHPRFPVPKDRYQNRIVL